MYQINLRSQASKLVLLAARVQQRASAEPRRASTLHAVLAGIANLATLRVMPGIPSDAAARHDPRDPRNW